METKTVANSPDVSLLIYTIRGVKVILDADLASLYGVTTKRLNQQVRRNQERFPEDFVFQLTQLENDSLRLQIATSKPGKGGPRYLPLAYTEHGAIMAGTVLNSPAAVSMSIFVVRAFIKMREALSPSHAFSEKLMELEQKLLGRLDTHEKAIIHLLREIRKLKNIPLPPEPKKKPIGFVKNT